MSLLLNLLYLFLLYTYSFVFSFHFLLPLDCLLLFGFYVLYDFTYVCLLFCIIVSDMSCYYVNEV